jgi:hypothetical protein
MMRASPQQRVHTSTSTWNTNRDVGVANRFCFCGRSQ